MGNNRYPCTCKLLKPLKFNNCSSLSCRKLEFSISQKSRANRAKRICSKIRMAKAESLVKKGTGEGSKVSLSAKFQIWFLTVGESTFHGKGNRILTLGGQYPCMQALKTINVTFWKISNENEITRETVDKLLIKLNYISSRRVFYSIATHTSVPPLVEAISRVWVLPTMCPALPKIWWSASSI